MMNREVERRLAEATEMAKQNRHEFVTLEHILLALTKSPITVEILEANSVNVQKLKKDLKLYLKTQGTQISSEQIETYGGFDSWNPEFTLACHRLIQRAALQIKSAGKTKISEGSLLVSLFYELPGSLFHKKARPKGYLQERQKSLKVAFWSRFFMKKTPRQFIF
ncbi:MAG TPA: Clp protease N-terminal domain-containing protein [Pseudobdellovibrionaceae bacterium]|nr:Clp protease N-terminal domain-containing protein [Pseudobdellovibrionaceae bacterium]